MNLPKLAIERPVFVTCIVTLIMVLGLLSWRSLGRELFPDVSFPFVIVTTPYQGAAPQEIETQISKPLEEELSSLQGVKRLSSVNTEGFSSIFVEFTLETDSKEAEQNVRDKVAFVRPRLPRGVDEPVVQSYDPSGFAVVELSLKSDLPPAEAYDLADQVVKPQLAQVPGVGVVNIQGGRKREILVELDRAQLNRYRLSAGQVADRIAANGTNVPVGKVGVSGKDLLFRSVGEYNDLERLKKTSVNFLGSDVSVPVERLGRVVESLEEPIGYSFANGTSSLFVQVYKQSKANTVSVVDDVLKRMEKINEGLKDRPGSPSLELIRETALPVRLNLSDVEHTIQIGIGLTVLVVLLFLGSLRSTFITITALPVSLLGALFLMEGQGFTLNVMTLLALSLAIGLLIDDAIVVRENIWRHMENGEDPKKAAIEGTKEVALAVIATSSVVIAVFFPIAFLQGMVGQFFKQFGLTVCFAMVISFLESMAIGPMLSAYWARDKKKAPNWLDRLDDRLSPTLKKFDQFQTGLEERYEKIITWCVSREKAFWFVSRRLSVLLLSGLIFLGSLFIGVVFVKKTFLPTGDFGEFMVLLKADPGTSLEKMRDMTLEVDAIVRKHPEVVMVSTTVGGTDSTGIIRQSGNVARLFIKLKHYSQRERSTEDLKIKVREELEPFRETLRPQVAVADAFGDQAPFTLNLIGEDYAVLAPLAQQVVEKLHGIPGLIDIQSTYEGGKDEFQVRLDPERLKALGASGFQVGMELRTQVEGALPAKFRSQGHEYDIRVRLKEDQKNIQKDFHSILVPNQNYNMVRLSDVASPAQVVGPSVINRQNRARYVQITGQMGPGGAIGNITADAEKIIAGMGLPKGILHEFVGQAEDFRDLGINMMIAFALAIFFTYMILSSLYESPILPLTIMTAIPMAIVGAFLGLFLTGLSLDIFSMIAIIMLLGLVTKNSILLVDYAIRMQAKGMSREDALRMAGKVRLRPILMTTSALVFGMMPLALALTEVGKFRQSMGVAVEGGLISSLVLTLVVVPALFGYVDDLRLWLRRFFGLDAASPRSRAKAPKKA